MLCQKLATGPPQLRPASRRRCHMQETCNMYRMQRVQPQKRATPRRTEPAFEHATGCSITAVTSRRRVTRRQYVTKVQKQLFQSTAFDRALPKRSNISGSLASGTAMRSLSSQVLHA